MARLGIMGGTFDPIHIGHLDCARNAQSTLALDEIMFMPAFVTNFKQDRSFACAEDRLCMCSLAIQGEPTWQVSSLEIDRGGTTYTIDTLHELQKQRPGDNFFFITGSDSLRTLAQWKGAEELARLAIFVAVERPGYGLPQSLREGLSAAGFTLECISNSGYDVSSSEIRARRYAGRNISGLVPDAVLDYICEHGLYV